MVNYYQKNTNKGKKITINIQLRGGIYKNIKDLENRSWFKN